METQEELEEQEQIKTQEKEDWLGLDNFDFGLNDLKLDFDFGI